MALTGYRNSGAKNSGGIASIKLIEAGKILGATYDPASDSYTAFKLVEGSSFNEYQFREDQAIYRETLCRQTGSVRVSHELSFLLDRTDAPAKRAVEQICEASIDGMIAIITDNNGESSVVGYSRNFGAERPLRLIRAVASSGTKPADHTAQTILLYCEDTQKATPYRGL